MISIRTIGNCIAATVLVLQLAGCGGGDRARDNLADAAGAMFPNGAKVTRPEMSLTKGAAYFSVTLDGSVNNKDLSGVTGVQFNGADALSFYAYPNGTKVVATAPANVTTGPVVVKTTHGDVSFPVFEVVAGADPGADFATRDLMPQTAYTGDWCDQQVWGTWGPGVNLGYGKATVPAGVDPTAWKRARVIAAAFKWLNMSYQHHHIPAFDARVCTNFPLTDQVGPGLDCSNFTTWVYTYAFGYNFTSAIQSQADSDAAGTLLSTTAVLQPGDLLFARGSSAPGPVTHVAIYIDPGHRIDSTDVGVQLQPWGNVGWWPYNSFDRARRPLDLITTN